MHFLNEYTPNLLTLLKESPINIKARFLQLGYEEDQYENAKNELVHFKLATVDKDGNLLLFMSQ